MRTTVTIDDELYTTAMELAEPGMNKADLVREAICTFIRVRAAERLSSLGGKAPDMAEVSRRKEVPESQ
ncbi:type II toxin-antitoxin system VapB family antitoxin [Alteromonas sp. RKMC-009]|uniref:type II toxin-antitoxin system VapB family antitoxin n=1 Tax=Alteromonas sp. RKMC-009 TaxID=2267264 RepID=UPI000E6A19F0|nr:type II toxin-antitoxin system VapB family antitoxin [Alteromonas sp. RKMC-009]AYA62815.1 type II toxin-antitoxin system VapB family antitoxin [Alteromonas sp. RKMC-009]MEC7690616.1 type II toxin-antitoxin system VapB family antitoxin [Pseudomonadota bacterium]